MKFQSHWQVTKVKVIADHCTICDILSTMANISGRHISLTPEDIVHVKADVIVSSIHQSKNLSLGVLSSQINKIGGPLINKELAAIQDKELAFGQIVRTSPGKLATKCILFVCLCRWSEGNEEKLQESIYECLKMASEQGYKSIAFPALGTGLDYTPFISAMSILTSITHFFCDQGDSSLETVNICLRKGDTRVTQNFIDTCCSVFLTSKEDDEDTQVHLAGVETLTTSTTSSTGAAATSGTNPQVSTGAAATSGSSPQVSTGAATSGSSPQVSTGAATSSRPGLPTGGRTSTKAAGPSAATGAVTRWSQFASVASKLLPNKTTGIKLGGPNSAVYLTIQPGFNASNLSICIRGEIQLSLPKLLIAVKTFFGK